jgi:diguanylate cyclase (GGDEF)-like protein/PAS domain S-box-containing protein
MIKKLRIGFLIGLLILIIDVALPLLLAQRAAAIRELAAATAVSNERLQQLLSAYKDAETGQRGFTISGRREFLTPYHQGRLSIDELLPQITAALRDQPQYARYLQRLQELDQAEAHFLAERIEQRRRDQQVDGSGAVQGKLLMDSIRLQIDSLSTLEQQRINVLLAEVKRIEYWSHRSLIAVTAIDIILFAVLYGVALRAMRAQHRAGRALQTANTSLNSEIAQRNAALEQLQRQADHLNEVIATQTELMQSQLDIRRFLELVVERMLTVTAATGAVVEMIDNDEMVYQAASGSVANFVGIRLKRSGSLSGLCIEQQNVLIATDTRNDARVDRAACEKVGALSMVVVPLLREGDAIGVLKIVSATTDAFDASDIQTLQLMSGLLGAALGHQLQFDKNQDLLADRNITLKALKREIHRHEEYEVKLITQRQRTETILEASHEAFICIDRYGTVQEWNIQAANTFGWSKQEALGKTLEEMIIPERYHEAHHRGVAHFLATGEGPILNRRIELQATRRDGSEIPIELTIAVQRDGDNVEFPCFLRDISARKAREQEWRERANIDHLTGVSSRSFFLEMLDLALPRHQRANAAVALLYLDIDRFKHINDTYGHAAGDTLLKEFAKCLKIAVRQTDVVGRLGGDEFCIILDNIKTADNAIIVAEKILELARTPLAVEERVLTISTSIGIAFAEAPTMTSAQYIALADAALYKAKQAGRNGYVLEIIATTIANQKNMNIDA